MTPRASRLLGADSLVLLPATPESARAELESAAALGHALGAEIPPEWPPDLYDRPAVEWGLRLLESDPEAAGWGMYYFLVDLEGVRVLVGVGGYKGKPSPEGEVEIGYSILGRYQGRGLATEAAARLVRRAFQDERVQTVVAETLTDLPASIRVLEKAGFSLAGEGSEAVVVRYSLKRE